MGIPTIKFLQAEVTRLTQELEEEKGVEGRCPVGHHKKFTYALTLPPLDGYVGCVACERNQAIVERDSLRSEVERLTRQREVLKNMLYRNLPSSDEV